MPQLPSQSLFAVFAVVGVTLFFALAYNLGSTAEETRAMRVTAQTRQRMATQRDRLNNCLNDNRDDAQGRLNSPEAQLAALRRSNEKTGQDNEQLQERNVELRREVDTCSTTLAELKVAHTGTASGNATHELELLEEHLHDTIEHIELANRTKAMKRDKLRRMVRAYELEIADMVMKQRRAARERAMGDAAARAKANEEAAAAAAAAKEEAEEAVTAAKKAAAAAKAEAEKAEAAAKLEEAKKAEEAAAKAKDDTEKAEAAKKAEHEAAAAKVEAEAKAEKAAAVAAAALRRAETRKAAAKKKAEEAIKAQEDLKATSSPFRKSSEAKKIAEAIADEAAKAVVLPPPPPQTATAAPVKRPEGEQ